MFVLHCIDTASDSFWKTRESVTRKDFCASLHSDKLTAAFKTGTVPWLQRTVLSSIAHLKKVILLQIICLLLKKQF